MNPYLILLKQAVYARRSIGKIWAYWFFTAIPIIAIPLIGGKTGNWPMAISIGVGAPILILLLLCWAYYIQNALSQNNPINAQLTPKLRHRLIITTIAVWFIASTMMAAILAFGFGHLLQFWVSISLFLMYFAFAASSIWSIFIYFIGWYLVSQNGALLKTLWSSDVQVGIAFIIVMLTLLVGAIISHWIFRKGGDRHWRDQARIDRQRARSESSTLDQESWRKTWPLVTRITLFGYSLSFKKNEGHRVSPEKLVCYALGPGFHWWSPTIFILSMLCAILTMSAAAYLLGLSQDLLKIMTPALMFMIWLLPLAFAGQHIIAVYKTRNEQALLRLAPITPQGRDLNQIIARTSLQYFVIVWGISTCLGTILPTLTIHTGLYAVTSGAAALELLFAGLFIRDYARAAQPSGAFFTALMMLLFLSIAGWLFLQLVVPIHTGMLFVICMICSALFTCHRWKKAMAAPVAFPAGRLAPQA